MSWVDLAGAPTFGVLAERDTPRAWVDKLAADHDGSLLINPHTHWTHHRRQNQLAVWQAKAVLEAGGQVIYIHFEEASPHGIIHRLKGIGVAVDVIRRQFHWGHVNSPWKWGEMAKEIELEQPHN